MKHEKQNILEAIRLLIAYYGGTLREGCGYTGNEQLVHLTKPQAQTALRYGVPIGIRDAHRTVMGAPLEKPYRYITIPDVERLERWLAISSVEPLASIHADLPAHIQHRMREYILQIMEIECQEHPPPHKPITPMLGARGDFYNLLCIANRTLRRAGQQEQAEETLKAVRTVRQELGLQTVLGVSNISFGLPNRALITQNFLIQALAAGLTLPIVNPNQREMMDAVAAFRVLSGEDDQCRDYIARFAAVSAVPTGQTAPVLSGVSTLEEAVARGLKADAARLAKALLQTEDGLTLVERRLIPALDSVGEGYERGTVFLPQLLSAAQAAQEVFEAVRASIVEKGGAPVKKGKLIVATVRGDIHDIGKNIVKTVLENYGYEVVDLGRDVPPETVAQAAAAQEASLVGLSALMTTTLPAMEETVRRLRALERPPVVFVGGAVVTPEYAARIGADEYARDARQSVEIARRVLG